MQKFILHLLIRAVLVYLLSWLLPGIHLQGFLPAVFVVLALALLNQFVKPLIVLLTLPVTILTIGLFMLVINALIIMMAAWIVVGFDVSGFWAALLFSFVLSILQAPLQVMVERPNRNKENTDR